MKIDFCNTYVDEKEKTIQVPEKGHKLELITDMPEVPFADLKVSGFEEYNFSEEAKEMFKAMHEKREKLTKSPEEKEL